MKTPNHVEIEVAIGIIIKPIRLKKVILIKIFNKLRKKKHKKESLYCFVKKKFDKILIRARDTITKIF